MNTPARARVAFPRRMMRAHVRLRSCIFEMFRDAEIGPRTRQWTASTNLITPGWDFDITVLFITRMHAHKSIRARCFHIEHKSWLHVQKTPTNQRASLILHCPSIPQAPCARTHARHLLRSCYFATAIRQPAIPGGKEEMKHKAVYLRHWSHISQSLLQTWIKLALTLCTRVTHSPLGSLTSSSCCFLHGARWRQSVFLKQAVRVETVHVQGAPLRFQQTDREPRLLCWYKHLSIGKTWFFAYFNFWVNKPRKNVKNKSNFYQIMRRHNLIFINLHFWIRVFGEKNLIFSKRSSYTRKTAQQTYASKYRQV